MLQQLELREHPEPCLLVVQVEYLTEVRHQLHFLEMVRQLLIEEALFLEMHFMILLQAEQVQKLSVQILQVLIFLQLRVVPLIQVVVTTHLQ